MKIIKLFLLSIIISSTLFGQDSLWGKSVINEVLTLNLPVNAQHSQSSYVKGYGGYADVNFYALQYYDTILNRIETERDFQIALTGFLNGRMTDPGLKKYNSVIIDTAIGETRGIMAKFRANDTAEVYKQIFYYVTLANSQFYWFYVYAPSMNENNDPVNLFFKSILFDSKKVKESSFKLTSIYLK